MADDDPKYVCLTCRTLPYTQPRPSLDRRYAKGYCPTCKDRRATFIQVLDRKEDAK